MVSYLDGEPTYHFEGKEGTEMALQMAETPNAQRLLEYNERRTGVLRAVNRLRYGTRAEISRALGISPATISGVLNGRIINPEKLDAIEQWLRLR